jgi:hypothetical protein
VYQRPRGTVNSSVGDPDPQDPHVFGPPGSGSISQRYGSGSGSFFFLIKVLSGILKVTKDRRRIQSWDPLVIGTDLRIQICTKMSRINRT